MVLEPGFELNPGPGGCLDRWRDLSCRCCLYAMVSGSSATYRPEAEKREAIYGEFIMSASKVLVSAYISDKLLWTGDEQHLIGLINRMRLFAPPHIIAEAEDVIRNLIQIALQPRLDMQELARTTLTDRSVPDLLFRFSVATQADLKNVYGRSQGKHGLDAVCVAPLYSVNMRPPSARISLPYSAPPSSPQKSVRRGDFESARHIVCIEIALGR